MGSSGNFTLSSLNGSNGFVLNAELAGDLSGYSVASAGDVNGDGIADLVIGALGANSYAGKSYVVFGRAGLGSSGSLALSSLNGTSGFVLNGEQPDDYSSYSVASAGDVNGDGIADLVIGAYGATSSGNFNAGKSYVVFGRNLSNATFLTTLIPTPRSITSALSISAQPTPLTTPLTTALVPSIATSQLTTLTVLATTSSQAIGLSSSSSTLTTSLTSEMNTQSLSMISLTSQMNTQSLSTTSLRAPSSHATSRAAPPATTHRALIATVLISRIWSQLWG